MALNPESDQRFRKLVLSRGLCDATAVEAALALQMQKGTNAPGLATLLVEMGSLTKEQAEQLKSEMTSSAKKPPVIPGYKITGYLRRIGMVRVYSGHQQSVDREVELRVLLKTGEDGAGLEQFQREGRLIAGLNHPNISGAIDMGETPSALYLALHHFRGRPLSELLKEKPQLPAQVLLPYAGNIAEAIGYLHGKELAHGKICAENIIITDEGQAILTGFDLISENGLYHPGEGDNRPRYFTPGLEKLTTQAADLFCFGCTLFEAATGKDPLTTPEMINHQQRPVAMRYNYKTGQRLSAIIYSLMNATARRNYKATSAMLRDFELLSKGHIPLNAEKLPGIWGRKMPVYPVWPTSKAGTVLLYAALGMLGLGAGVLAPLAYHADQFFAPPLSAEAREQEYWQNPVKFGDNANPARSLWIAAEKLYHGSVGERNAAKSLYEKLVKEYPVNAYARAALNRLKELQK